MTARSPGWLERALKSGDIARAAYEGKTHAGMLRILDVTSDAFIGARTRYVAKSGKPFPAFEELRREGEVARAGSVSGSPTVHRWPNLAAFEAADFRDEDKVRATNAPYQPPVTPLSRKLTRDELPDGSLILWASDIHIPIHNEAACRLMVECAERNGVTRVVAGGDILDMNCLSKHAPESRRSVEHATILEEVEPGRWLLNWFATKQTDLILGNHEDRLKRFVDDNPVFHGSVASNFAKVVELPDGINVIPQGGEVRLGNLSMCHLDALLKNGTGGKYPAQRVLDLQPDHSTIGGHVHRITQARRTSLDEDGIKRTRCAWTMGHMSHEHMHHNYVSVSPNWQTGFGLIRVWWEGDRPRWSVYPIEVLFDRYNRPYFEFNGAVHR